MAKKVLEVSKMVFVEVAISKYLYEQFMAYINKPSLDEMLELEMKKYMMYRENII